MRNTKVFILKNNQLEPINKVTGSLLISPNDIVMISENQFYITNFLWEKSIPGRRDNKSFIEYYNQIIVNIDNR